jgi:hypothetical protein
MGTACSTNRGNEEYIQDFCRKTPEGKVTLGRTKRRWKDNIRMSPDTDQWRALVNTVINLLTGQRTISSSRRTLFHGVS